MSQTKSYRKFEIAAGLGFILATFSYATGSGMASGILKSIETGVGVEATSKFIAVGLESLNTMAVIGIGYCFYHLLKQMNERLARGYLMSRVIEGVLLSIGSLQILLANPDTILMTSRLYTSLFSVAMLILGVYSCYFFYRNYQMTIEPGWLLLLGVVGYGGLALYGLLSLIGLSGTATMLLFIPGGLFELLLPLILIFKGLKYPEVR